MNKKILKKFSTKRIAALVLAGITMASSLTPAMAADTTRGTVTWKEVSQGINSSNQYVYDGSKFDFSLSGRLLPASTFWGYIENGKVNTSKNGVYGNMNGWYLVKNGKVDFSANGLKNVGGTIYSFSGGKRVFTDNGTVLQYGNGDWRYMVDGEWKSNYTGFAGNKNGVWRIKDGKVDFTYTGVIKDPCGLTNQGAGWVYFKEGKFDQTANTVAKNEHGWWKITNGQVDFNFNGIASNENGSWYISNGKVPGVSSDTSESQYNGFAYGFWIQGSKVQ